MDRRLLFLLGCIPTRSLLAYSAYKQWVPLNYIAVITFLIAIGFFSVYFFKLRPTGAEAGGKIWWNSLRPIHGIMYLTFTILVFTKHRDKAWYMLLLDVIVGLISFIIFEFNINRQ